MSRQKWTDESLIRAFINYAESGGDIRASKLRKERGDLYGSILYRFKSYPAFISQIGFDYKEIHGKRFWTNDDVIREFKEYESTVGDISPKLLQTNRTDLYGQITYKFGTYKAFLEYIGYDYDSAVRRRIWDESDVVSAIRQRISDGDSLRSVDVLSDHFALYRACCTVFGSYRNALEKAGIDYTDHVGDFQLASAIGFEFENTLDRMFTAMGKGYQRHTRHIDGIVPDFYDSITGAFIDAKLSSWTVFYSDTIEKYVPHCTELTIVYLRGPDIKRKIPNVNIVPVSYYYPEITAMGFGSFIAKFDALVDRLERSRTEEVAA